MKRKKRRGRDRERESERVLGETYRGRREGREILENKSCPKNEAIKGKLAKREREKESKREKRDS